MKLAHAAFSIPSGINRRSVRIAAARVRGKDKSRVQFLDGPLNFRIWWRGKKRGRKSFPSDSRPAQPSHEIETLNDCATQPQSQFEQTKWRMFHRRNCRQGETWRRPNDRPQSESHVDELLPFLKSHWQPPRIDHYVRWPTQRVGKH